MISKDKSKVDEEFILHYYSSTGPKTAPIPTWADAVEYGIDIASKYYDVKLEEMKNYSIKVLSDEIADHVKTAQLLRLAESIIREAVVNNGSISNVRAASFKVQFKLWEDGK